MDPVSKAQSTDSQNRKDTRWKKGQSGNPGGRPKKLRITKMFEEILSKPQGRKEIKGVIRDILEKRGMASVLLLREMTERTEGKVTQEIDLNAVINTLSDDELTEKLAKLVAK